MITADANDLDYLVNLYTPIPRESEDDSLDKITRCLFIDSVLDDMWYMAKDTAWYGAQDAVNSIWPPPGSRWYYNGPSRYDEGRTAGDIAKKSALEVARAYSSQVPANDAWHAAKEEIEYYDAWKAQKYSPTIKYLHVLGLNNFSAQPTQRHIDIAAHAVAIGKKSYQISECLILLSISRKVCRNIQKIAENLLNEGYTPTSIPKAAHAPPWVKKYSELFLRCRGQQSHI